MGQYVNRSMKALHGTVLRVLASHLGRPTSTILPWQELERDLDVTPLEIALMVAEIENLEQLELDVAGLRSARTFFELVTLLTREVDRARFARGNLEVA